MAVTWEWQIVRWQRGEARPLNAQNKKNMSIREILATGANVAFTITATDLKEFLLEVVEEQKKSTVPAHPEKYLTAQETADKLGVRRESCIKWNKRKERPEPPPATQKLIYPQR